MVLNEAFGRQLDHKGEALINEISAFTKEAQERFLPYVVTTRYGKTWLPKNQEVGSHRTSNLTMSWS